jgi:hypothetical protein
MATLAETRARDRLLKLDGPAVPPEVKARQLLCDVLPKRALQEFLEKDYFHVEGKVGVYRISRDSQTEIYRNGRLAASGCLQLTVFAPTYDRMLAEYLVLKNDERLYWTKANIFPVKRFFDWRILAIAVVDFALMAKLVLDYLY